MQSIGIEFIDRPSAPDHQRSVLTASRPAELRPSLGRCPGGDSIARQRHRAATRSPVN